MSTGRNGPVAIASPKPLTWASVKSAKRRFLFAIVGLALLAGAANFAGASLPAQLLAANNDQHTTIVASHEANISAPAAANTRDRRLDIFGAAIAFLALVLAAAYATPASVRTPATGRRGRFFVRRRGPPALLVAA